MKTIESKNAWANLEASIEYVNKNKKPLKIISENGEAILIDIQTWSNIEMLFEKIEDIRLLELAQERKGSHSITFKDLINKEGFDFEEIKKLSEKVKIE